MGNVKYDKILDELREKDGNGFVFVQAVPDTVWTIPHNLDKRPSITIVDSGDNVVEGQEVYVDNNNVILNFEAAFTGKAYLT